MIKNFRLLDSKSLTLDGYVAPDGYGFSTNWIDLLNCSLLGVSVVFVGGAPSGLLEIWTSNDVPNNVNGLTPLSAWNSSNPSVLNATALDSNIYIGSTQTVTGAGTYTWAIYELATRWVQVVYVAGVATTTTASVFLTAKSVNS